MTLRVGRISYANMAPAFFDLSGIDIVEVPGVPTELNAMLLVGREGHPFRRRERQQLLALARIADRLAALIS